MSSSIHFGMRAPKRLLAWLALAALGLLSQGPASAQTALADQPVLSSAAVPGNLVMPLSVEYPTGVSVAHAGNYDPARNYLGYFDPLKCYTYVYNATETLRYFQPARASATRVCAASGEWSGNFLNWATMQTIDPFRWALTGGKRTTDTTTVTIIEKANASGQGVTGNFPNRELLGATLVAGATPFGFTNLRIRIEGLGYRMRFTQQALSPLACDYNGRQPQPRCNANNDPPTTQPGTGPLYGAVTAYNPGNPPNANDNGVFEVSVRVRVCDPTTSMGVAGVESNCRLYGSNYKPEGLIQQYSDRIRYSAFGYLNDSDLQRDGGVLRARQKFVGPLQPRPNQASITNPNREWDATTGVIVTNPDTADATAFGTAVANSGVINYLNKFGQTGSYKGFDPVSELYYAAIRYLKNQGNVPEWSNLNGGDAAAFSDGFPVITNWTDPIQYSCQANFILGIGDVNTHADKNVPGATGAANEPTKPDAVSNDSSFSSTLNAVTQTNTVGTLEGMGNSLGTVNPFNGCCNNNSALMAGLAYDSHVRNMRPDLTTTGKVTAKTFWVDVLEGSVFSKNNQYYLAAKYGGFTVPTDFDPSTPARAAATFPGLAGWNSNGQTLDVGNSTSALPAGITVDNESWGAGSNRRPDSYFTAGTPDAMVAGLTAAFSQIASDLRAATTSFALASPQVTSTGNVSYSATYSSGSWSGSLTASTLAFDANGVTTATPVWSVGTPPPGAPPTDLLANQLAGTGWDCNRRVITYRSDSLGVPFRRVTGTSTMTSTCPYTGTAGLSATQLGLLDTPYGAGTDSETYLNYLRGDRSNEVAASTSALGYRVRTSLLGDIAGSKVTGVAAPNSRYSDAANPGYADFVTAQTSRQRMVYVGANDGMMHAFNGELTGTNAGSEVFAYVPSALFNGPTAPATDGLVSRGNPVFDHRALVDSTPEVFDIDFNRTQGQSRTSPDWRSVLIGGLGKGGRRYYAIDVTNPTAQTTEAGWAGRVLWEFPDASRTANNTAAMSAAVGQMGFTYGRPLVTKLAKYGWVVIFPSGYSTSATSGSYLFIVNPQTGALLETVTVGSNDTTNAQYSTGLGNVQAYRLDFADNTAESLYAGDLQGNVWRVDVRGTGAYQAVNFARLTTAGNVRQPITTRLLVEVDPASGRRYVLAGTGSLLDTSDIASTTPQTFYAIADGSRGAFSVSSGTFPFPITRSALVANTDTSNGTLVGTGPTATAASPLGWFIELGTNATGQAWRVVLDPATNAGRVLFSSLLPSSSVCTADSSSRVYEVGFGTGQSVQLNTANTVIAYSTVPGIVIDNRYLCNGTTCKGYTGSRNGDGSSSQRGSNAVAQQLPGLRRLNWRELQIVQ